MLSTCMSMPITSSTGRTRPPISRPSCGTSIDCGRGAVWRCGQGRPAQAALATGIRGCAINHPEEVQARLASGQRVQIIDMRPRHYSSRAVDIVEGFCGAIPSTLTTGLARFPRKRRWSRFVCMAFTLAARAPSPCGMPGLMLATCPGDTTHGKLSRVRSSYSNRQVLWTDLNHADLDVVTRSLDHLPFIGEGERETPIAHRPTKGQNRRSAADG